MIHKTIAITIGLALVLIAVISTVPMIQQKVYAQAGSPGVGSVGGSGSGNPFSGGNQNPFIGTSPGYGGFGTKGSAGAGISAPLNGAQSCSLVGFNCGGGAGTFNSGGSGSGVPLFIPSKGGTGGNGVGPGGAP